MHLLQNILNFFEIAGTSLRRWLPAAIGDKLVISYGPENRYYRPIRDLLIRDMFLNLKTVALPWIIALVPYYVILWNQAPEIGGRVWAILIFCLSLLVSVASFFTERLFRNREHALLAFMMAGVSLQFSLGISVTLAHGVIEEPSFYLVVMTMAGIAGIQTGVLSGFPGLYFLNANAMVTPIMINFLFLRPELHFQLLGGNMLVYLLALTFFTNIDTSRRVAGLVARFQLDDAKKEVETAKEQQDGDYYLISLLLQPLQRVECTLSNVRISSFLKSKKTFQFRNSDRELGGDINIVDTLRLKDEEYAVVLNADAMGKSIQGAGGALVLGSVFQSILQRTRAESNIRNMYPERWLKTTFTEMHRIFERFEGSMSATMILALVSESGIVYFLNAEHPMAVLYRDGDASYIPDVSSMPKLGNIIGQTKVRVQTVRLQQGDVLLFGSDGRDDLNLDSGSVSRRINDSSDLFLRIVSESLAEPEQIFRLSQKVGEVIDDYSLVKISYMGKSSGISAADGKLLLENRERLRSGRAAEVYADLKDRWKNAPELSGLYLQAAMAQKFYSDAAEAAEFLAAADPMRTEPLLYAAMAYEKAGLLEKAADYSERLYLREPAHVKNLAELVKIYSKLGNTERARKFASEGIALDPDNAKFRAIAARMKV